MRTPAYSVIAKKRFAYVLGVFVLLPTICQATNFRFSSFQAAEQAFHCDVLTGVVGFEDLVNNFPDVHFGVLGNDNFFSLKGINEFDSGFFTLLAQIDNQWPDESYKATGNTPNKAADCIVDKWTGHIITFLIAFFVGSLVNLALQLIFIRT